MKRSLKGARLYLILDAGVRPYDQLFEILKQSLRGGVDLVQLRDKKGSGRQILDFSKRALRFLRGRIPFIINDRVDLAVACRADGVHLGQEDLPIAVARDILGKKAIIGLSCQTWAQARAAQRAGADYIGFGSVFKTLTKPDRPAMDLTLLEKVVRGIDIPVFAIGGIKQENIPLIRPMGVDRVAVTRAICLAGHVAGKVAQLRSSLQEPDVKDKGRQYFSRG